MRKALRQFSVRGGESVWEPVEQRCPYCWEWCEADWVDVEVGLVQCGPFFCTNCGASSIGPYDEPRPLTYAERKTGWYRPGSPVSDKANTFMGIPVSHKTAKRLYEMGLLDPPGPKPRPGEGVVDVIRRWFDVQEGDPQTG